MTLRSAAFDSAGAVAVAVAAARAAAQAIRAAAADPAALEVRAKRPNDFVTRADTASERVIVETLLRAYPGHAVRTEESAQLHGAPGADAVWIVDPLDGTTNFIHAYPVYAVSIALALRGRVEVGVVLDVARDELFTASRGAGAACNGVRLRVSGCAALADAVVATSAPLGSGPAFDTALRTLGALLAGASAVRRSGSAALDLAWVAAGRCDAVFDRGLAPWDVAAGSLLIEEAGGVVSTFDGGPDVLEARECLGANAALHERLREILGASAAPATPSPRH